MKIKKSADSEVTLHRLWSELTLLRQEVEQAEGEAFASQAKLQSDQKTARDRIQALRPFSRG